jgi:predicted RNase H-like HicB family nuclease
MKKILANKKLIFRTVKAAWSDEDEAYVACSPLVEGLIGVGDTQEEAVASFQVHLDALDKAAREERHAFYKKAGRPNKDKVSFNTRISPDIRDSLKAYADGMGCSAGEVIEYLFLTHQATGRLLSL